MRTSLRVIIPLRVGLASLAWAASLVVNETTEAWFTRDVEARARLAASGVEEAGATHLRSGERRLLVGVVESLARAERITSAEVFMEAFMMGSRTVDVARR